MSSVAAVIKHVMTLDGAQYMQELRRNIAETKAAEQAMKAEAKAMGVIAVSGDDVRKATDAQRVSLDGYGRQIGTAITLTKSFNAAQTALNQAMGGNFIGAAASGTRAASGFKAALSGIGTTAGLVVAGIAAVAAEVLWMRSVLNRDGSRDSRFGDAMKGAALENAKIAAAAAAAGKPFIGDEDRIVAENDEQAALRELASASRVLEEKKRQLQDFNNWKAEREFAGYAKGEKEAARSAEDTFRAEFAAAQKWVAMAQDASDKVAAARRKAYEDSQSAANQATDARNAEGVRKQKEAAREWTAAVAEASEYARSKWSPGQRLKYAQDSLKFWEGRPQDTAENVSRTTAAKKAVDQARRDVAAAIEERRAKAAKAASDESFTSPADGKQDAPMWRGTRRTLSVESMGMGDVFTRMRGMHGAVLSPKERSARDAARTAEAGEKTAGLLEKIEKNLKPIR